jgi:hypothetical protein
MIENEYELAKIFVKSHVLILWNVTANQNVRIINFDYCDVEKEKEKEKWIIEVTDISDWYSRYTVKSLEISYE